MQDRDWIPLFVGVTTVQIYQGFLPALHELRDAQPTDDQIRDLRISQVAAIGATLLIGITASIMMDNAGPAVAALIGAATLTGLYEYALRGT